MKNSSDTIGNRTRDLPTCSPVPQPTAPPRTPLWDSRGVKSELFLLDLKVKITGCVCHTNHEAQNKHNYGYIGDKKPDTAVHLQ
jgi:hypothetical protein